MANSPHELTKSPARALKREAWEHYLLKQLSAGRSPEEIAGVVAAATGNGRRFKLRRRKLEKRIWHELSANDNLTRQLADRSRALLAASLPSVTLALVHRAQRGNVQAIKLVYEASGYHNPRMDHNHTGEIKISLSLPRPPAGPEALPPAEVVDAEIVDD